MRSLRHKLSYRGPLECGCENECAYCRDYGHSACWRKVALWRRLWILWREG